MHFDKWNAPVKAPSGAVDSATRATDEDSKLNTLHTKIAELEREIATLRGSEARARVLGELIQRFTASKNRKHRSGSLFRLAHIFQQSDSTPLDEWKRIVLESKLFDSAWYSGQNSDVTSSGNDPLLHFLLFGAYEGRSPNAYFDPRWYLETYPDVRDSGLHPLVHYIQIGEPGGRCPGPHFDPVAYLRANPDVAAARMRPLRHFLLHGRKEGRTSTARQPKFHPIAPPMSAFYSLAARTRERPEHSSEVIDIVVPVYRGYDDTLACLHSVLVAPVKTPFELIVVDDCSPERELSSVLQRLSQMNLITLLTNDRNLGFVVSVNRGMRMHSDRDVLMLNSDTEVYGDWLDRLSAQARRLDVATVTPFSNNATICSYPQFNCDNPAPLEIEYAALDQLASQKNAGEFLDVVTGVGFCMLVTRKALDDVGYLDEEVFGRGYGEENDFCIRAQKQGFRNIMALDVFVRHTGETSFGPEAGAAQQRGITAIQQLHPEYITLVHEHIRLDPARSARQKLDCARLKRRNGDDKTVLCLTHNWGGGINRHLQDKARALQGRHIGLLMLSPTKEATETDVRLELTCEAELRLPNLRFSWLDFSNNGELVQMLREFNICLIEVHSLVGWPPETLERIGMLAEALSVDYEVVLHDYVAVCPRINLINETGIYCGEEGIDQCRRCLLQEDRPLAQVHGRGAFEKATLGQKWN